MINLECYEMRNIFEMGQIERAKAGKVYPKGSTLIQLSASRGQVLLHKEDGPVGTQYAVLVPPDGYRKGYVFISITQVFHEFIHKYQTGINLQFDALKYLEVPIHNEETQRYIEERTKMFDRWIEDEVNMVEAYDDLKTYFLENMFINGN